MDVITDDQITELRALAIATLDTCAQHNAPYPDDQFWRMYARRDIADYAARSNPGVILALLDRLADAERERDTAQDSLNYMQWLRAITGGAS